MLSEKIGLNGCESRDMVEAFFEEIREALERGEVVKLSGFGNFQVREKSQRPGRNPTYDPSKVVSLRNALSMAAVEPL